MSEEELFENSIKILRKYNGDGTITVKECVLKEEYDKLQQEKIQLQNNWNELKKFVEERIKFLQEEKAEFEEDLYNKYETNNAEITIRRCNLTQLEDVQEKMQELEGNNE